ncbi:MAG: LysM peptidoglycan-binding domain-containing protein [Methylococcales bacterium]|nr:LysM peptidoglycan-binding domain-containing protein [Methylococcales bacterium]
MSKTNSVRPTSYLLYLSILMATGCAEQSVVKRLSIYDTPSSAVQQKTQANRKHFRIAPINSAASSVTESPVFRIEQPSVQTKQEPKAEPAKKEIKNAWDRLASLYQLSDLELSPKDHLRINQQLKQYLNDPHFLSTIQERAKPYLHFILDEIESQNLPGELALLPAIESSYRIHAKSRSKALGLWQFIPATGRLFGLKQNGWYDGRKDIYKSTQAATKYLGQLSRLYDDDWSLALAAYNVGKGNIKKARHKNRQKNLPTDYWSLPLPRETRNYVPRLLALAKIFANAEKYGVPLLDVSNEPYFSVVDIKSPLDIPIAAKIAKMSVKDFVILNPAFKRSSINKQGSYRLLVEKSKAKRFKRKLALTAKRDRVKPSSLHKIRKGESLSTIARLYGTSIRALRKDNELSSSRIKIGQRLYIPYGAKRKSAYIAKSKKRTYTVKKGDTFWEIAKQFSVRSKDIARWNRISLAKALQPGQKLIIKKS